MAAGVYVYPQNRSKIIHLVRTGQGTHGAAAYAELLEARAGAERNADYNSEEHFDAKLTPAGWTQVDVKHNFVRANGLSDRIQLVVVSCMLRSLQTAVGIFGGEGDVGNTAPLMIQDARYSNRPAIPNSNYCPPFVAVESCREQMGNSPCHKRRKKSEYEELFPAVDFSLIESEEDDLSSYWYDYDRLDGEPDEDVANRGVRFFKWLFERTEKEIAVVSHTGFLFYTLAHIGEGLAVQVRDGLGSCSIVSYVMEDNFINNLEEIDGAGDD